MICPKKDCVYNCDSNVRPHLKNKNCKSKPFSDYCPPCVIFEDNKKYKCGNIKE